MAVVEIIEPPRGNRSGSSDHEFNNRYTRVYQVRTDNRLDGPATVRAGFVTATGLSIGDTYSEPGGTDGTAFLISIEVQEMPESPDHWTVTCNYGPWPAPEFIGYGPVTSADPTELDPKVEIDFVRYEKPTLRDKNGNAILNSAGDPFSEDVVKDDSRPVLIIVKNKLDNDLDNAVALRDKVNNATFFGFAAGQVKMLPPRAVRKYNTLVGLYWEITYQFEIATDPNGWKTRILDAGMRFLSGSTRKAILIDGNPASEPVALNGSGGVLAVAASPVFRTFELYESGDFSVLGLE